MEGFDMKKRALSTVMILCITLIFLTLSGCGGSDSTTTTKPSETNNGSAQIPNLVDELPKRNDVPSDEIPELPDDPELDDMPPDEIVEFDEALPEYTLTIRGNVDEAADVSQQAVGTVVTVHCTKFEDADGEVLPYQFIEWEGLSGLTITEGSKNTEEITFIMPDHDIEIKAIFE